MNTHEHDETARLTADALVFARHHMEWHVLLIKRRWEPFRNKWAIPGGHVNPGETFYAAALRELEEETGVKAVAMRQVGIYDAPERDPRGRYVSVAFMVTTPALVTTTAGDDAQYTSWAPIRVMLREREYLAFDHAAILADAAAYLPDYIPGATR